MSEGNDYGQGFLAGMGTATVPSADWTEQELTVLGEVIRDEVRKAARRGVEAYVRGGVERKRAEQLVLYGIRRVAGDLLERGTTGRGGRDGRDEATTEDVDAGKRAAAPGAE